MLTKRIMKGSVIIFSLFLMILLTILAVNRICAPLFSTVSPHRQYKVAITQSRPFPFFERAVFLNAYRNDKPFVQHKLLYTGEFLDEDFRDLYPNPRFRSESIFELGSVDLGDGSQMEATGNLRISNATLTDIDYLLIETGWYKLVVLDVKAGATADLGFQYGRGISCQGQFASSGERFSAAVGVETKQPATKGQILITIAGRTVTIESPQLRLASSRCCASDRPDPTHEWLY